MKRYIIGFALLSYYLPMRGNISNNDVLFHVLKQETNYYYSRLLQDSVPVNYLSLNATREEKNIITSEEGLASVSREESSILFPVIQFDENEYPVSKSLGKSFELPFANDTVAIKDIVWRALERCYREAKWSLSRLNEQEKEKRVKATPVPLQAEEYLAPFLPPLDVDTDKWKRLLNNVTMREKEDSLSVCKASLSCVSQRKYFTDSEGRSITQNYRSYILEINVSEKDDKGIPINLYKVFYASREDELPSETELLSTVNDLKQRTAALRKAPMAEAFTGPVLFSGEAAGVFFHEVLGHRLENETSEFKPRMGLPVLPAGFNVTCDPTVDSYNGIPLHGGYMYDDEGTKAQRVECIKDGLLRSMLTGRWAESGRVTSNGHGRADAGHKPSPRQSNFIVETDHPYSPQQLREMLIRELKTRNIPYGYYIRSVSNGWTRTSSNERDISSYNVVPLETYKIYADGRPDSLVRGVSFIGTPLAAFSNIKAAGGSYGICNGRCGSISGWIPVSLVAPMLYVSQIETQCIKKKEMETPLLPQPEIVPEKEFEGTDTGSLIFKAMEDEMKRSMDSLKLNNGEKPYFIDYRLFQTAWGDVGSVLGACKRNSISVENTCEAGFFSGNAEKTERAYDHSYILPKEIGYSRLRREFWQLSSNALTRLNKFIASDKEAELTDPQKMGIPEFPPMPGGVFIEKSALESYKEDVERLKGLADTLSAVFKNYPQLFNTSVWFKLKYLDTYRLTSEGLRMRVPTKEITLESEACCYMKGEDAVGERLTLHYYDCGDLPPTDSLIAEIGRFASRTIAKSRNALPDDLEYMGPVLYEQRTIWPAFRDVIQDNISCNLDMRRQKYDNSYKKIGKSVLNRDVSVWQTVTDSVCNGHRLFKYRKYDTDGIARAKVELIRNGVLVNQLSGRTPSPAVQKSTGNERLPGPGIGEIVDDGRGVLRISFNKTTSYQKLVKKLIRLAKNMKQDYAYIIMGSGGCEEVVRLNVRTGKREDLRLNYEYETYPHGLQLMGDMWASKEISADGYMSVIHPKAVLFPMLEIEFEESNPMKCSRIFLKLRH